MDGRRRYDDFLLLVVEEGLDVTDEDLAPAPRVAEVRKGVDDLGARALGQEHDAGVAVDFLEVGDDFLHQDETTLGVLWGRL